MCCNNTHQGAPNTDKQTCACTTDLGDDSHVTCTCQWLLCADNPSVCVGVCQSSCTESRSALVDSSCSCVEWTSTQISVNECQKCKSAVGWWFAAGARSSAVTVHCSILCKIMLYIESHEKVATCFWTPNSVEIALQDHSRLFSATAFTSIEVVKGEGRLTLCVPFCCCCLPCHGDVVVSPFDVWSYPWVRVWGICWSMVHFCNLTKCLCI